MTKPIFFKTTLFKQCFLLYQQIYTYTDSGPCQMDSDLISYMQNCYSGCVGHVGTLFGGKAANLQISKKKCNFGISLSKHSKDKDESSSDKSSKKKV